jgi:hypothetical protein
MIEMRLIAPHIIKQKEADQNKLASLIDLFCKLTPCPYKPKGEYWQAEPNWL